MTKDEWYAQLFERLGNSKFRSSFHLKEKDKEYVREKGLETIRQHARDFIAKREAPAVLLCEFFEIIHTVPPHRKSIKRPFVFFATFPFLSSNIIPKSYHKND